MKQQPDKRRTSQRGGKATLPMPNESDYQMPNENEEKMSNKDEHQVSKEGEHATSTENEGDSSRVASNYTLSAQERAVLVEHRDRREAKRTPRLTLRTDDQQVYFSNNHPRPEFGVAHLERAIGTADSDFFNGLIARLAGAYSQGAKPNEDALNFAFSVIKGNEPRDQNEALLAR
jgi:hypothetical protein